MVTTTSAADDDEDPRLTPEQRQALHQMLSNPALMESVKRAQSVFNVANRQISTSFITGMAPALEQWREQHRQIAKSIAPMINAQAQFASVLAPLANLMTGFQRDIAKQLSVAVLANAQLQTQLTSLVVSSEFTESLRRINDIASMGLTIPTDDGFTRLADLIDSGEIDENTLDEAEEGIAENAELLEAIDAAAEVLSKSRPLLSRRRARQIIVFWVWLMYGACLWVVAVLTNPAVAAIPGAIGLPSAPAAAKKVSEKLVPRSEAESHDGDNLKD